MTRMGTLTTVLPSLEITDSSLMISSRLSRIASRTFAWCRAWSRGPLRSSDQSPCVGRIQHSPPRCCGQVVPYTYAAAGASSHERCWARRLEFRRRGGPALPTVHEAVLVMAIAFLAGFIRLTVGMGAGATLTPIAVWGFRSPATAVAAMAGILWFTDVQGLLAYWRRWDRRLVRLMLPTTAAASLAGAWFLTVAPTSLVRHLIGLIALIFVALNLRTKRQVAAGAPPRQA